MVENLFEAAGIESSPRLPQTCSSCGQPLPADAKFCPFDGQELASDIAQYSGTRSISRSRDSLVGWIIDERYEVLQLLGEGGMGCVYRVRHRVLGRLFALKALRPELARDIALAERFVQEARAAAAITDPHVVSITDFGMLDEHQPYFVMELLEGRTLSSVLRERCTIEPGQVALIARSVASALSAAHQVGVVHRDLKPDNVILLGDATNPTSLKVLDFGLAQLLGKSRLTRDDIVYGTPQYMSPEQAAGESLDPRVDVYALGILMYEMLVGRVPFEADSYMGVLTKQLYADPPRIACPDGLEQIVLRCLRKDRNERYGTMVDVIEALEQLDLGSQSVDSVRTRAPSASRPMLDSRIMRRKPWRRRWWGYALAGAVALGWALGLLFGRLDGGDGESLVDGHKLSAAPAKRGQSPDDSVVVAAPNSLGYSTQQRSHSAAGRTGPKPDRTTASLQGSTSPSLGSTVAPKRSANQPVSRGSRGSDEPTGATPKTFGGKSATGSSEIANPWPE